MVTITQWALEITISDTHKEGLIHRDSLEMVHSNNSSIKTPMKWYWVVEQESYITKILASQELTQRQLIDLRELMALIFKCACLKSPLFSSHLLEIQSVLLSQEEAALLEGKLIKALQEILILVVLGMT